MPNWTSITVADLKNKKAATLIEKLGSVALGSGQEDPTSEIIADVVTRIRAEVKGCARNQLDEDTTKIPGSLKSLACRMIYVEMAGRIRLKLTDDELKQNDQDLAYLARIAACKVPVDTPDNPIAGAVQAAGNSPRFTARTRNFSRESQEGA